MYKSASFASTKKKKKKTYRERDREKKKMGGSNGKWWLCGMFRSCFSRSREDDYYSEEEGGVYMKRRICASDEDRGGWIAEPGIDRRATAFIARFYDSHTHL